MSYLTEQEFKTLQNKVETFDLAWRYGFHNDTLVEYLAKLEKSLSEATRDVLKTGLEQAVAMCKMSLRSGHPKLKPADKEWAKNNPA